ncbi:MAG: PD-(D/E)XK nuclease family protein [Vampirovibrionia bacterium]
MKLKIHRYEEDIIQKLGFSFCFTNSERNEMGCPRKWYFSYNQGLSSKRTSMSFAWGISWHTLMEDLFLFWKEHDKEIYIDDPLFDKSFNKIKTFLIEEGIDHETVIKDLRVSLEGYLIMFGNMPTDFKVVEVEVPLRFPVKDFRGEQFFSKMYIEEYEDCYKLATPSTINKIEKEMPFFVIGRADAIVQSRVSGELFIYDHKTTASINRFLSSHEVDPQLCSYAAMLEYEKNSGYLQGYKQCKIGGVIYGLTHNGSTNPPKPLKTGGYSKAKSNKSPSWIYQKAVGNDTEYDSHISKLKEVVDPLWHRREWLPLDINSVERWKNESYGVARRLADNYRCLSLFENSDSWATPRVPICKTTGFCQYKEICVADSPFLRGNFNKLEKIIWSK